MNCKTCKWLGADSGCHRYPPSLFVENEGKHNLVFRPAWPHTEDDDYCGEWSDSCQCATCKFDGVPTDKTPCCECNNHSKWEVIGTNT